MRTPDELLVGLIYVNSRNLFRLVIRDSNCNDQIYSIQLSQKFINYLLFLVRQFYYFFIYGKI